MSKIDRENLEWIVFFVLTRKEPVITMSRGRELLGFENMKVMRGWFEYCLNRKYRDMELEV